MQQKKNIEDAMEDLRKLIPYMKNKIKPTELTTHQLEFIFNKYTKPKIKNLVLRF